MGLARRLLGLALVVASLTPVFLLLDHPGTGVPGQQTVALAWTQLEASWWGALTVFGAGLALAMVLPVTRVRTALRALGRELERPPPWMFAVALGVVSGGLAVVASRLLFAGLPTLQDGMASLVHARYLAAGHWAGTVPEPEAAWLIPNTLLTEAGWISQYPPLHPLLLAAGIRLGAPWLVGPVLLGITVMFSCRTAELVLEDRRATARAGGVLVAVSPFLVFLGAGYLSHVSAAALSSIILYAAVRSLGRQGSAWPIATGLAAGALVATRPWTGLFLGVVLPTGLWCERSLRRRDAGALLRRLGAAAAGGLPWILALGLYNHRFFGDPLVFGYTASYGGEHLPGFGRDPWGHLYGLREAVGYTGADLLSLGTYLLESPLPAVLVVGAALALARELPRGTGILTAWALLPVAAGALYWHHGFHMGPRMLYEAAPAWCLLFAVGAVEMVTVPAATTGGNRRHDSSPRSPLQHRGDVLVRRLRKSFLFALLLAVPAAVHLAVERGRDYGWDDETLLRLQAPDPGGPALVFVHGSWTERVGGRLRAAGMTADSVETALRRNDLCAVHRYASGRSGTAGATAPTGGLDMQNLPGAPASLQRMEVFAGYRIRRDPGYAWTGECERELAADREGIVSLAPLLWQGDLPGIQEGRPLFVRDLGPQQNEAILEHFPNRRTLLLHQAGPGTRPRLERYDSALTRIWKNREPGPSSTR